MSTGQAQIEITASSNRLAAGLAAAGRKFTSFSTSVARGAAAAFKRVNKFLQPGEIGKKAAGQFLGNMATRGLDVFTETANGVRDFERSLVRFQIVADKSPASMRAFRQSVNDISRQTAISRETILAGAQAYVDITGDVAGATREMGVFAKISQASDANMSDVALAAAAMQDSMKLDPSEFEATFSGLINQGKKGAVTLKDFAAELTGLSPQFARFGVTGRQGVLTMGAMLQIGRKGFKDAAEAATGMESLMGGMKLHADKFAAAGVQIFHVGRDGTKSFRPLSEIITDIGKSSLAKDPRMLFKAFGRKEGEQFYVMLKNNVAQLREMEAAGQDVGTVGRDAFTFLDSDAGRIDQTLNALKITIAETFTPERIKGFTTALQDMAHQVEPVVTAIGKIGSVFGSIYGAGKSIRGWISGNANNNPFADQVDKDKDDHTKARSWRLNHWTEADFRNNKVREDHNLANKSAYDATVGRIMGATKDERSTPESILAAIVASTNDRKKPGGIGEYAAGVSYLENVGVDAKKARELYAEALKESLKEVGPGLLDVLKTLGGQLGNAVPPVIKIGDNQLVKSNKKATAPRRGTQ